MLMTVCPLAIYLHQQSCHNRGWISPLLNNPHSSDFKILQVSLKIRGITDHDFSVFFPTGDFRKFALHRSMSVQLQKEEFETQL